MLKVYTIIDCQRTDISSSKGSIKYVLRDENDQERSVTAIAKFGLFKRLKSVHAIHFRETPLIEALAKASVNEQITIDFTDFNKLNPRESSDRQRATDRQLLKEMTGANGQSAFSIDSFRILQLFIVATLGLGAFLVIKSFFV